MITDEELNSWTLEQLKEEWLKRMNMLSRMVGWLYPPVVRAEMDQIETRVRELNRGVKKV